MAEEKKDNTAQVPEPIALDPFDNTFIKFDNNVAAATPIINPAIPQTISVL